MDGTVEGDPARVLEGLAPVDSAGPADLTFVTSERYARLLAGSAPGAVLISHDLQVEAPESSLVRVDDPQRAFALLAPLFVADDVAPPGVSPAANVADDVSLGAGTSVGPHAVIGKGAVVGDRTRIGALTVIGPGARIGNECIIGDSCTILGCVRLGDRVRVHAGARIGTDGFGFTPRDDGLVRMPQVGRCIVGDDVEIGANTAIDRGALGDTVIGDGTKIDNLVQIAHNVRIGRHCVIAAQVGIAGSVDIGDRVQLAGQVGIADHLSIGDGARVAAQSGVSSDIPAGATYFGYPARPHGQAMRAAAAFLRLPDVLRRLKRVERDLASR